MKKNPTNKNCLFQMKKSICVFLLSFVLLLGSRFWIMGNDENETERLRAKGKWIYALGAVPEGCIGLYHVGLGFIFCIGEEGQNIAGMVGAEIDYSGGRGEKMEKLEERGTDGWQIIHKSKGSFYFINLSLIAGVYFPRQKTSIYLSVGNAYWQSKLKNWGNYPTLLGIGFKWYPSNRIAIRVAELRLNFIDEPGSNTIYTYDPNESGKGIDTTGLGLSFSSGFELRW